METKENRPDACTASGTAKSIYKYFSTDAPDIQEEKGWLVITHETNRDFKARFVFFQNVAYTYILYT